MVSPSTTLVERFWKVATSDSSLMLRSTSLKLVGALLSDQFFVVVATLDGNFPSSGAKLVVASSVDITTRQVTKQK
jgi:hypothetical protein